MRALHAVIRGLALLVVPLAPIATLHRPEQGGDRRPTIRVVNLARAAAPGAAMFEQDAGVEPVTARAASAPPEAVGIVGRLPDDAQAMVRIGGEIKTLTIGEQAGGWTLAGIEKDRIRLRRGGEERTLVLPFAEPDRAQ